MSRWAVILAGGVGSRFWPVSTPDRPKQLLPLATEKPLLRDALDRLAPLVPASQTLILTNAGLVDAIAELAPEVPRQNIIAEPRPAGTAAALAWAASEVARRGGRDSVMISVHADWAVGDPEGFRAALNEAANAAERHHALVTVGVVPVRADPGFGYIQPEAFSGDGESDADARVLPDTGGWPRRVKQFVEKPTRERAGDMVRDGYLWNSGIFVWRAGDFLDELDAHTPEVAPHLSEFSNSLAGFFEAVKTGISVDVGVLERSARVLVIAGSFGWDDVGNWGALRRVRKRDAHENALSGAVHALEASGNVVHAEGNAVVLYGVSDLVVVTHGALTIVTTVDKASDLKSLIASLPPEFAEKAVI